MACEARIRAFRCQCGFNYPYLVALRSSFPCYVHAVLILSSMAFHADSPIKRSRSPQNSSQIILTHSHIADALSCSPDHGATLILSKLNVSECDTTAIHDLLSLDEDAKDARPPVERYVTESIYYIDLLNDQ